MAGRQQGFVGSRAGAFCESQAHARTTSGSNVASNVLNVGSFGCVYERRGFGYGIDFTQYETGGSYTSLGVYSPLYQPHSVATSYFRCKFEITSTPPASGGGGSAYYSVESLVHRGSGREEVTTTGAADDYGNNGVVTPDSQVVSITSTAVTITWSWSGSGWTEVAVLTFSDPYTLTEFCDEAAALFLGIDLPADNAGGQTIWLSEDGVPFLGVTSADTIRVTEDAPFGQGAGVILGDIFTPAEHDGIISIVGVQYRLVNIQAALYTRAGGWQNERLSATSEKLPFTGSEYRWVIPTAAELAGMASGTAWQAGISTLASYTSPTPDFPLPV